MLCLHPLGTPWTHAERSAAPALGLFKLGFWSHLQTVFELPWQGATDQGQVGVTFQLNVVAIVMGRVVPLSSGGGSQGRGGVLPMALMPNQRCNFGLKAGSRKGLNAEASIALQRQPFVDLRPQPATRPQQAFRPPAPTQLMFSWGCAFTNASRAFN